MFSLHHLHLRTQGCVVCGVVSRSWGCALACMLPPVAINDREKRYVDAVARWCNGDVTGATGVLEAQLLDNPYDVLTIRLLHDCYFNMGDLFNLRNSVARVVPRWSPDMLGYPRVLGMYVAAGCALWSWVDGQHRWGHTWVWLSSFFFCLLFFPLSSCVVPCVADGLRLLRLLRPTRHAAGTPLGWRSRGCMRRPRTLPCGRCTWIRTTHGRCTPCATCTKCRGGATRGCVCCAKRG